MKLRDLFDRRFVALGRHLAQPWAVDPVWLRAVTKAHAGGDRDALQALFLGFASAVSDVEIRDGVGIVSIRGPLIEGSFFQDYTDIRNAVDELLVNSQVNSLLLDIDSPGGDASGALWDLAGHIRQIGEAKTIHAIANDQATSAAYVIASSAEKVFISGPSTITGSLGVIATHIDESGFLKQRGVKITEVVSGRHKNDTSPNKPLNADGRATLEALVESAFVELIDSVTAGRGITEDAIREQEAAIFIGREAMAHGLADGIATRDELVEQLAQQGSASGVPALAATTHIALKGESEMQERERRTAAAEGAAEAAAAERGRVTEIRDLCRLAGCPEKAADYMVNGDSIEQVRAALDGTRELGDDVDGFPVFGGGRSIDVDAIYRKWNRDARGQTGEAN